MLSSRATSYLKLAPLDVEQDLDGYQVRRARAGSRPRTARRIEALPLVTCSPTSCPRFVAQVFADEAHDVLILRRDGAIRTLSLRAGSKLSLPVQDVGAGSILSARLGPCRRMLALQRDDSTVDVVDLWRPRLGSIAIHSRAKARNRILPGGVFWCDPVAVMERPAAELQGGVALSPPTAGPDAGAHAEGRPDITVPLDWEMPWVTLALVTAFGLEVHRISPASRASKHVKTLGKEVSRFWALVRAARGSALCRHPSDCHAPPAPRVVPALRRRPPGSQRRDARVLPQRRRR